MMNAISTAPAEPVMPHTVRAAVAAAHQSAAPVWDLGPARGVAGEVVLARGILPLTPIDGWQSETGMFVLRRYVADDTHPHWIAFWTHTEVGDATEWDVIVPKEHSGLRYPLVVCGELYTQLLPEQIAKHVAQLDPIVPQLVADAMNASNDAQWAARENPDLDPDDYTLPTLPTPYARGPRFLGACDWRRAAMAEHLGNMNRVVFGTIEKMLGEPW